MIRARPLHSEQRLKSRGNNLPIFAISTPHRETAITASKRLILMLDWTCTNSILNQLLWIVVAPMLLGRCMLARLQWVISTDVHGTVIASGARLTAAARTSLLEERGWKMVNVYWPMLYTKWFHCSHRTKVLYICEHHLQKSIWKFRRWAVLLPRNIAWAEHGTHVTGYEVLDFP